MEIGKIGQGGQALFDNLGARNNGVSNELVEIQANTPEATPDTVGDPKKDIINDKELNKALDKLKTFIEDDNTKVEYQYHSKFSHDLMIKIVNKDTNEVLLEVPPKKILDLVARMMEMVGVLFDKKA